MCDCLNNTDPTWEPESQAVFRALAAGKFPLNKEVKDGLDAIVKLAKSGNAPPPAITLTGVNENVFSSPSFEGREIAMLVVNDTPKTFGFKKQGDTPEEMLASDTVEIIDGGVMPPNSIVVVIFK